MASPGYATLLFFFLFAASASISSAFNITKILDRHPGFSALNNYLTQTQLADEINRRQTITVLAVDDVAIGAISGKPIDVIKKIIGVHVILDYYDLDKLQHLHKKTALLTTLFQSTGLALGQTGFLNVTVSHTGVVFGSAVADAGLNSRFIEPVAAQPYNISVLHVSSLIIPPGIESTSQTATPSPPPPSSSPPPAAAPELPKKSTPPAASPAKTTGTAPSQAVDSPPAPAAPVDAPADAPADETDEPSSPEAAPAGAPATSADSPDADADTKAVGEAPGPSESSSGKKTVLGVASTVVMFVGCLLS